MSAASIAARFFFYALRSLLSMTVFVLFRCVAMLVVSLVQALRVTGTALGSGLDQVSELVRSGAGHLVHSLLDLVRNALSDTVGAASGSLSLAATAPGALAERFGEAAKGAAEVLPEVMDNAAETVSKVVNDLWEHYKDAVRYVVENV